MWSYYTGREVPMGPLLLLAACTGAGDDSGTVGLPPEDTSGWVEDTGTFPIDSGDTAVDDEAPPHLLALRQAGVWTLGGDPDDPSSMTGTLTITEVLDGDAENPTCLQEWAMVGARAEEGCDGCFTFTVEHTQLFAEGACRAPELPDDGEVRALGLEEAAATIWWDWYDTGAWVPLWETAPGELPGEIAFSWEVTVGIEGEDEDE